MRKIIVKEVSSLDQEQRCSIFKMNFLFKMHNFFPVISEKQKSEFVSETVKFYRKNFGLELKYRHFMTHGLVSQDL